MYYLESIEGRDMIFVLIKYPSILKVDMILARTCIIAQQPAIWSLDVFINNHTDSYKPAFDLHPVLNTTVCCRSIYFQFSAIILSRSLFYLSICLPHLFLLLFSKCFRDGFLSIKNKLSRSERRNLET